MIKKLEGELRDKIWAVRKEGDIFQMRYKYLKAIEKYKEAISLLPEPVEQWDYVSILWYSIQENYWLNARFNEGKKGGYTEALEYWEKIMKLPNRVGAAENHFRIGQINFELGQFEKATDELLRAYLIDGMRWFNSEDQKYFELIKPIIDNKSDKINLSTELKLYSFGEIISIEQLIELFKNWLTSYIKVDNPLKVGATDEAILALEKTLEGELPEDFKQFYKLHNGQSEEAPYVTPLGELLSLDRITLQWNIWKGLVDNKTFENNKSEPDGAIKNDWYNLKWIPFTHDGSGNHLCIDLDPAEGGHVGQVITMWHDEPRREWIAGSFQEWLSNFVNQLNDGYFRYDPEMGSLERMKW